MGEILEEIRDHEEFNYLLQAFQPRLQKINEVSQLYSCALRVLRIEPFTKMPILIQKNLDPQALEFYLRTSTNNNALSQRLHIISYLLEAQGSTPKLFINKKSRPLVALVRLTGLALTLPWLWIKGLFICRRYQIV